VTRLVILRPPRKIVVETRFGSDVQAGPILAVNVQKKKIISHSFDDDDDAAML